MIFFRNVEKNYRRPGRGRLLLIAFDHAVADAGFGEDVGGLGGVFFDLAADVGHVDAEDLVVAAGAGAPELFDENKAEILKAQTDCSAGLCLLFRLFLAYSYPRTG